MKNNVDSIRHQIWKETESFYTIPLYRQYRDLKNARDKALEAKQEGIADELELRIRKLFSVVKTDYVRDSILEEMSKAEQTKLKWIYRKKRKTKATEDEDE